MAEEAQSADILNVQHSQEYTRRDIQRGQAFGFVAMLAAMGGAIFCAKINLPWVATAFLSMTVMAVAKSFVESIRGRDSAPDSAAESPAPRSAADTQDIDVAGNLPRAILEAAVLEAAQQTLGASETLRGAAVGPT